MPQKESWPVADKMLSTLLKPADLRRGPTTCPLNNTWFRCFWGLSWHPKVSILVVFFHFKNGHNNDRWCRSLSEQHLIARQTRALLPKLKHGRKCLIIFRGTWPQLIPLKNYCEWRELNQCQIHLYHMSEAHSSLLYQYCKAWITLQNFRCSILLYSYFRAFFRSHSFQVIKCEWYVPMYQFSNLNYYYRLL